VLKRPLPIWKFAMLLAATATLYQFVWLYALASELRESRKANLTPWHWVAVPLLGPLVAIPVFYLAKHLDDWRAAEGKEPAHLAEPVLISLLALAAWVPLLWLIFDVAVLSSVLMMVALLMCIPYLVLQAQLNLNAAGTDAAERSPLFTLREVAVIIGGLAVAVPLYLYVFTNTWEMRGSSSLAIGDAVQVDGEFFRVVVGDEGWTRVAPGYIADESAMEFLGPNAETWAIVYDATGMAVDDLMAYRIRAIREDHREPHCSQAKTLENDSTVVLGVVECSGRSFSYGNYMYVARILRHGARVVEIVAGTTANDDDRFKSMKSRVYRFADGLEIVP
jgi:hypothetical protein